MKKRMRTLICLALVIMLVAIMAVPAMAVHSGTGIEGQHSFKWDVICGETTGEARIRITSSAPSYVTAVVENSLVDYKNGFTGTSADSSTGYFNATAIADNYIVVRLEGIDRYFPSEITRTKGIFYVGSDCVMLGAYDSPS